TLSRSVSRALFRSLALSLSLFPSLSAFPSPSLSISTTLSLPLSLLPLSLSLSPSSLSLSLLPLSLSPLSISITSLSPPSLLPPLSVARWLRCLHCRLTARRSWVRFPHGALLALGGRSSPDLQCSGGLSPGPFCVCMFSPCSQGVSSNRKTCKQNRTLLSVPNRDGRLTLSPGAEKLPTAPGVLEEGQSGMG